jgi:hypothetical protein
MSEYTGYESAFVPSPAAETASPEVERKTSTSKSNPDNDSKSAAETKQQAAGTQKESNVLNGYRSITYNFILAGLPKDYLTKPEAYREGELNLVILKSGGKGDSSVTPPAGPTSDETRRAQADPNDDVRDKRFKTSQKSANDLKTQNAGIVQGFNQESPGRFDMFIDSVEIETLMAFTPTSGTTLPTKIKFDIYEPYSVNGFIEALHVTALAAGYTSYVNASYLLKVEFWGYADDDVDQFKDPVKIEGAERYFPIGFTNLEVEITERGTKYVCSAVPYNDRAFGQPSVIKKPIKMEGETVKTILDNLIKSVNEQVVKSDQDGRKIVNHHDEYVIKYVKWDTANGWIDAPESEIPSSKLLELFEDNVLYKFATPDEGNNAYKPGTAPKSIKYNPKGAAINFPENRNIHEIITAVIRDCVFIRDLLKDMSDKAKAKSRVDSYGMVEYFSVRIETTNKEVFDPITKRPYQTFTFVVAPYKVHFTRLPTYGQVQLEEKEFSKLTLREYNYIYTGKNIDVMSFKLNFNTLYFEAIPKSMADQNAPNVQEGAKPSSGMHRKVEAPSKEIQESTNPSHPMPPVIETTSPAHPRDGSAIPHQYDSYNTMARHMHEAIINSKASMITGEIDILGDPFYLVTGGMGNYNPKPYNGQWGKVGKNEVAHTYGEVNILINFRNPIDIGPDGFVQFDPKRVPFSGVYRVTSALHTFREGVFKQRLQIIRVPGQIIDTDAKVVKVNEITDTVSDKNSIVVSGPAADAAPSQRLDSVGISDMFSRGIPNVGDASNPSNFTNAVGGLGGTENLAGNQTFGAIPSLSELSSAAGSIGQLTSLDSLSKVNLNIDELAKTGLDNFAPAALLSSAAGTIQGNMPTLDGIKAMASSIVNPILDNALNISNIGSGIGEGATLSISKLSSTLQDATALDIKAGALVNTIKLEANSVNNIASKIVNGLDENAIASANRLGAQASNLVNDISKNIKSSLGSIADPKAVAANLGLNASKISGLSNNLQSKLTNQINDLKNSIPKNVDLAKAFSNGVAIDKMSPSQIANIPPTTPYMRAPEPTSIAGTILNAAQNPLKNITRNANPVDKTMLGDKINTVKNQLYGLTGNVNIVDKAVNGSVGAIFGSKNSNNNPLEQLIKKIGGSG